jgi:hypothetical protein
MGSRGQSRNEQTRGIRGRDHDLRLDHKRVAAHHGNSGKLRLDRTFNSTRTYGGKVEAQILPALGCLNQHAAVCGRPDTSLFAQP